MATNGFFLPRISILPVDAMDDTFFIVLIIKKNCQKNCKQGKNQIFKPFLKFDESKLLQLVAFQIIFKFQRNSNLNYGICGGPQAWGREKKLFAFGVRKPKNARN